MDKTKILVIPGVCSPISILESRDTLICWEWNVINAGPASAVMIRSSNASAQSAGKIKSGECPMLGTRLPRNGLLGTISL